MAITNAQQFKQLVNPPMKGKKRPGYRGEAAAASDRAGKRNAGRDTSKAGTGNVGGDFDRGSFRDAVRRGELKAEVERQQKEKLEEKLEPFRRLGSNQRKFQNFASKFLPGAMFASQFGPVNTRDFLIEKALSATNSPMTKEQFANLTLEQQNKLLGDYTTARNAGEIDAYFNPIERRGDGGGGINQIIPVDTTFAQAPSNMDQEPEQEDSEGEGLFRRFRAEGGIMNTDVVGGEIDFESARQMYGLGKLVKKVTRTVKKIAKSPVGKAALLYAGGSYLSGTGMFGGLKGAGIFSKANLFGTPALTGSGRDFFMGMGGKSTATKGLLGKLGLTAGGGSLMPTALGGIAAVSAVSGLLTAEQEEEAQQISDETGIDIAEIRANPDKYLARRFRAEGGSMKEPVAKKTMPLLDMDGQEMDLRAEGGFVPIGRMEKADDVPARLSKNEFVFTADAVRNAGEGNVDKGAEVMYNMMKKNCTQEQT